MLPPSPSEVCTPSRLQSLALAAAVIAVPLLLGLAGEKMRAASQPDSGLQSFDASRQLLFVAQPDGSVRVLNLRHTVGEVAALRSPQRRVVQAMQLSADGEELHVLGDDADYRYDAHSLRLLTRDARLDARLALASAPTAAGPDWPR